MATIEKYLEDNWCKWCKDKDIIPIKGPVMNTKGFPDRFLQLPNCGGTIYVEFKGTSYYDLTPMQVWWKDYIKNSSPNRYFVVDTKEELEQLKRMALIFMEIGPALTAFETNLLDDYVNKSIQ